jgi:plastocyanin
MKHVIKTTVLLLSITLAMAALNLSGCGDDDGGPVIPKGTPTRKIVLTADNFFDPKNVSIAQGDTIVWFNSGTSKHTTTSGAGGIANGVWNSGSSSPSQYMNPGDRFMHVFTDTVGVYPYFCEPHKTTNMVGTVTVTP